MDYIKTILIVLFFSTVCFGFDLDPNYVPAYSDTDPNIYDMSYIEMSYYESDLLADCNSVISSARSSVGLCDDCYSDPNSTQFTIEQMYCFEYAILLDRLKKLILLYNFENNLMTKEDYDLEFLVIDDYIVGIICRSFGLKWGVE